MDSRWLAALAYLCGFITIAYCGAVPTTFVVTKSVDAQNNDEPTTLVVPEPTTEAPLPAMKLLEMQVRSEVALRYSRTFVTTLVKNPAKRSQETTFRVLLPDTAFISGFSMTLEGKKYDAYVKEKEEAKQIYNDAVSQGLSAAHVATKARDSNHFTVSANVEANSTAFFNLTYEDMLVRHNDVYNLAINLLPDSPVNNLTVVVHIKESQKISTLRVPEISTGNEIIATENDAQNQKAEITRSLDGQEVTVVFKPDLEEQKKLREIYAQKTKESLSNTFNSFPPENEEESTDGALGQFVVQYDVDRSKDGNEVLVNDGYFVHFFAPSDLPPLKKYVVFVLDLSGSMGGRPIEQLREGMQTILGELHEGDYFSIVLFESSVKIQDLNEIEKTRPVYYDYEQTQELPALVPPYPATPENIAKAKNVTSKLEAGGGTNIAGGLDVAIALVQKGIGNQTIIPANESNPTNKETNDDKNLEPVIIFLTDGEPTVGETDPRRIINSITEKNYGERKASIFSLAFGDYADRNFLRKFSLRNNGFSRHIYEAADAALQLRDFYKQISSPLISHVKFTYPPEQVKEDSLTKNTFRTFYAGSEVIVAGRLAVTSEPDFLPTVHGFCGTDGGIGRRPYETNPIVVVVPLKEKKKEYLPLERLWAYLTIKQLLDERDAAELLDKPKEERTEPEKKALELALKYSFVTELTSLVVVKPNATNAVNAESVDQGIGDGGSFGPLTTPIYGSVGGPAGPAAFNSPAGFAGAPGRPGLPDFAGFPAQPSFPAAPAPSYPAGPGGYPSGVSQPSAANSIGLSAQSGVHGGFSGYPTLTPLLPETVYTPELTNPLALYQLEQYPWTKELLDSSSDELVIHVNGTVLHLKLTKDFEVPQRLGDTPCSHATDGAAGSCVYLTRCDAAQNITVDLYTSTYCLLDKYAGVCCPQGKESSYTIVNKTEEKGTGY